MQYAVHVVHVVHVVTQRFAWRYKHTRVYTQNNMIASKLALELKR
jgi:hypothetical protein